jgi:hypothetical protein
LLLLKCLVGGLVISIGSGMGDPLARSSEMRRERGSQGPGETAPALWETVPLSEDREQWRGEASPPDFWRASPVRNLLK